MPTTPAPRPAAPPPAQPVAVSEASRRLPPDLTAEQVSEPTRRPSRAGRNLPVAIAVGAGLGALMLACLLIVKEAFVFLAAGAAVVSVWELSTAFAGKHVRFPLVPVVGGTFALPVVAYFTEAHGGRGQQYLVISFTLACIAILMWALLDGDPAAVKHASGGVFAIAYVPFLISFAMLMLAETDGVARIATFVLTTIASDIGGYAVGVLKGKHPMAPTISPKKSWEGLGGSVISCVVVGAVCVHYLLHGNWWAGAVLGLASVATATIGDLSESLLKRDLGIKDMGNLLPGHGGLLDRLDSLMPTAPVAFVLLTLLVPAS